MKIGNVNLTENGSFMVSEGGKAAMTSPDGMPWPARIDSTIAHILCQMQAEINELKTAAGYEVVAVHTPARTRKKAVK